MYLFCVIFLGTLVSTIFCISLSNIYNRFRVICLFCLIGFEKNEQEYCHVHDCQEIRDRGFNKSGVYYVTPVGSYKGFDVYCDMETDEGGWLVCLLNIFFRFK